ncbi:MAG: hypothetical protein ACO3AD_18730 [Burkholderiaceae bacterium]
MSNTPPDWVLIEAAKRTDRTYHVDFLCDFYRDNITYRALCDMIEKYEQPPVDRKVLCAREAVKEWDFQQVIGADDLALRAIELWEKGFGK